MANSRHGYRALLSKAGMLRYAKIANFFGYDGAQIAAATIGRSVALSPTVSVRNGERLSIGDGAHIGQWTCLWAGDSHGRIMIGHHALLAPHVFATASDYDFDAGEGPVMDLPKREADIYIGANTWIGANVVIVAGVSIGDGAIIAAGSVVTRDVPPGSVAAGVPARVVRQRGSSSQPGPSGQNNQSGQNSESNADPVAPMRESE